MVMAYNKRICVNGETFSYGEFSSNPYVYLQKVRHLFRASTMIKKQGESDSDYYSRIFGLAYYSKHLAVDSATQTQTQTEVTSVQEVNNNNVTEDSVILNKLGINPIRKTAKLSTIVFKDSGNEYKIKNADIEKLVEIASSKTKYDRKNVDIKFGVEFEFIGLYADPARKAFKKAMKNLVGDNKYVEELRYVHNDGSSWILGTDTSLHTNDTSYRGYELTSPILTLCDTDLEQLKQVIELVYVHLDGHPNKTCGTHVHISFNAKTEVTNELCFKFAKLYRKSEDSLFDRLVPKYRRGNSCRYCLRTDTENIRRFCKLNLANNNRAGSKDMHLEFRQLNGTLSFDKVVAWVKLQKMFIEIVMNSLNNIESVEPLNLETTILDDSFNATDVENFMIMSGVAV